MAKHISACLFMRREPFGAVALLLIIVMTASVLIFPLVLSLDPYAGHLDRKFELPSREHWMGTDQMGRDVFSRIIYGGRISLTIGLLATLLAFSIGVTLGLLSGVLGGTFDVVVVQLIDISFAVPSLLLAIVAAAVLRGGIFTVVFALTLSGWGSFARISRGAAKQLITQDYVLASRSLGGGLTHILLRHVLPNALSLLIVTSTLKMGSFILGEAALSFLGVGINPPDPSWGGMVNDGSRFLYQGGMHPWLSIIPGILIALLVMSFNLLGDSLRDYYDVKKCI
ncbi:MAG: ABC transporter permease [Candidatus Aureabacteria bacterium]|nr:ABC transporter permease [Candidatus Auribacterota bacterium]